MYPQYNNMKIKVKFKNQNRKTCLHLWVQTCKTSGITCMSWVPCGVSALTMVPLPVALYKHFFETVFHNVIQTGLELTMQPRLASNMRFSCLRLLSARIIGVHHHTWPYIGSSPTSRLFMPISPPSPLPKKLFSFMVLTCLPCLIYPWHG
jgi:hypothetical protein